MLIPLRTCLDLDFTASAVWYLDKQHWLGWIPMGEPRASPYETEPVLDLLEICFRRGAIPTEDVFYDNYDSDHQISPVERVAGCHLDPAWVQEASYLGDRLSAISRFLAESCEFYNRGPGTNCIGDVPDSLDVSVIEVVFSNEEEAQEAANKAKHGLLSLLGFLSWMLSLVQLKDTKLSAGGRQYLLQLRLEDRAKTGAVFNLTRDQHEINFPHWANNGVPFHYVWTEEEAKNKCFLCFSPEYYEEVARLKEAVRGDGLSVEDLPSYHKWKSDLEGSDWIGQNLHLYGARPLVNWTTIRVYAERFKALIREGERETVCTFFRNNPIHQDEPAYERQPLQHKFALTDFAPKEVGEAVSEQARHYESNTVSSWARSVAGLRRRSSHSLSPPRNEGKGKQHQARSLSSVRTGESDKEDVWFHEEFNSAAGSDSGQGDGEDAEMGEAGFNERQDDTPFGAPLDSVSSWATKYRTAKEAVDALEAWAPSVIEFDPKKAAYDPLSWNVDWLERAYLVIDDLRTLARLKALSALFPLELDNIQAVLERGDFQESSAVDLGDEYLPSIYNMGYADQIMTWAGTSDAAQFGVYMGTIYQLLQKPNATAFIAKGGVCKFVAELFAPDLAYRFVRGPSEQVSEFGKGQTTRLIIDGQSTLCIADQVTDAEVAILLGQLKGNNWPSQALLEQHSLHVCGYLSNGAYSLLEYLSNRILVEKIYDWKTKVEWKAYLRSGAKRQHTPPVVPTKADFDEGWRILENSFPADWQHAPVTKIVLPEEFNPNAYRN
ncbi:hypothetical protein DFH08DRAFT_820274 [Mycena albidolilacea]|uniref:Uncharacterized protein n=1 Tax=Mycena albidolilacea TaxID=1033008 RepID=A0AAD6ZD90_9AGAR|nr:hypothetical protein DFH08DRAFT_820274 [Mycena albidolilacea]